MDEEQPLSTTPPDYDPPQWNPPPDDDLPQWTPPPSEPIEDPAPLLPPSEPAPPALEAEVLPPAISDAPADLAFTPVSAASSVADRAKTARRMVGALSLSRIVRWVVGCTALIWLYQNCHHDLPTGVILDRYAYPESKFLSIEGMQVHCRSVGRGEPILLLHDANSSLHTWSGWTDALSKKYRVISVDLPGFGLTGPHPQGSYSAFMYDAFLDSLVQQLALRKFHLAGTGLGAQIAWFYAAENAGRLDKLILLDAPGLEPRSGSWINWMARTPVVNRVLWSVTPRSFVELMLEDIYADDAQVTDSLAQRHFDLLLAPGNRRAFTDRASVSDNRPPVDLVDSIATPTLILWGAEDTRISPEHAYEFHRRIRGALLRIYQNTGHWPQEENPTKTAQDVEAFLEGKF